MQPLKPTIPAPAYLHSASPVLNYYDLLKIIAIFAMIVDHLNDYCGVHSLWLTAVRRVAMPLFLFLVGFNRSSRIGWPAGVRLPLRLAGAVGITGHVIAAEHSVPDRSEPIDAPYYPDFKRYHTLIFTLADDCGVRHFVVVYGKFIIIKQTTGINQTRRKR
jgi:hypothetical protein